jgi:hypothetical protein
VIAAARRPCFVRALHLGPLPRAAPELPRKWARYLGEAARDAVRAALWVAESAGTDAAPSRRGLFTATGPARYDAASLGERLAGGAAAAQWEGTLAELDPFALLKLMSCNVLAVASMALPAEGPGAHLCDDALGGLAALAEARRAIAAGALDAATVVAWDDLGAPHARAELAASGLEPPWPARQLAAIELGAVARGALAELGELALYHDGAPGPVGGAAGLTLVAEALAGLDAPSLLAIEVAGGGARVPLFPPRPLPLEAAR